MRVAALVLIAACGLVGVNEAASQEKHVALKPGRGLNQVEGHCSACHSLDYIPMNSPFLDAAGWNAEVTKMIRAFGAPIDDASAKEIVDYLTRNYGS